MAPIAMRFVLCVGLFVVGAAVMMIAGVDHASQIPLAIASALWLVSIVAGVDALIGTVALWRRRTRVPVARVVR